MGCLVGAQQLAHERLIRRRAGLGGCEVRIQINHGRQIDHAGEALAEVAGHGRYFDAVDRRFAEISSRKYVMAALHLRGRSHRGGQKVRAAAAPACNCGGGSTGPQRNGAPGLCRFRRGHRSGDHGAQGILESPIGPYREGDSVALRFPPDIAAEEGLCRANAYGLRGRGG